MGGVKLLEKKVSALSRRSYRDIVALMMESGRPVEIDVTCPEDGRKVQASLHAVFRRYAPTAKLKTARDDERKKVYAMLVFPENADIGAKVVERVEELSGSVRRRMLNDSKRGPEEGDQS